MDTCSRCGVEVPHENRDLHAVRCTRRQSSFTQSVPSLVPKAKEGSVRRSFADRVFERENLNKHSPLQYRCMSYSSPPSAINIEHRSSSSKHPQNATTHPAMKGSSRQNPMLRKNTTPTTPTRSFSTRVSKNQESTATVVKMRRKREKANGCKESPRRYLELQLRRSSERNFMLRQRDANGFDPNHWFLIDVCWLQEWTEFITNEAPLPGPIDNSRLVDPNSGSPKPGMIPVTDYRGVSEEIWNFWQERYGGGPSLKRRTPDLYDEPAFCTRSEAEELWSQLDEVLHVSQFPTSPIRSPVSDASTSLNEPQLLPEGDVFFSDTNSEDARDSSRVKLKSTNVAIGGETRFETTDDDLEGGLACSFEVVHCEPTVDKLEGSTGKQDVMYDDPDVTCSICFEDYEDNHDRIFLPCCHSFHCACVQEWISTRMTCPTCRHPVNDQGFGVQDSEGIAF